MVAARFKVLVDVRCLPGIAGPNAAEGECLVRVLCCHVEVFEFRADQSSRGVVPSLVCHLETSNDEEA